VDAASDAHFCSHAFSSPRFATHSCFKSYHLRRTGRQACCSARTHRRRDVHAQRLRPFAFPFRLGRNRCLFTVPGLGGAILDASYRNHAVAMEKTLHPWSTLRERGGARAGDILVPEGSRLSSTTCGATRRGAMRLSKSISCKEIQFSRNRRNPTRFDVLRNSVLRSSRWRSTSPDPPR